MSRILLRRFQTRFCGDGIAIADCESLCIVIWRGEVTHERFEKQKRGVAQVVAGSAPHSAGLLCIVEPHVKPPNDELRAASAELACSSGIGFVACVIEAQGFAGALTRSVLVGMKLLVGRRAAKEGFFSNVSDAAEWLSPQLALAAQEIAVGAAALRAQLDRATAGAALTQSR